MDNSVVATRYPGLFQVSTTDFFYPLVEDPYLQGRIAACNVFSDLYAMAVSEIDTTLMLVAVSREMTSDERDVVTTHIMRGYNDAAREAGTAVTGGQTVMNPWPMIGGVALSLRHESEFVRPGGLLPGDVLVLTKPLGTQVAVNLWQWRDDPERLASVSAVTSRESIAAAYDAACASMGRLNANAARAMLRHGAHGATDVTGFGIMGHASNLARHNTAAAVSIHLHTLPVLAGMRAADVAMGGRFKLMAGRAAETSGGLLVAFPTTAAAEAFIADVSAADGQPAWIVGDVVPRSAGLGSGDPAAPGPPPGGAAAGVPAPAYATIAPDVRVIEA